MDNQQSFGLFDQSLYPKNILKLMWTFKRSKLRLREEGNFFWDVCLCQSPLPLHSMNDMNVRV